MTSKSYRKTKLIKNTMLYNNIYIYIYIYIESGRIVQTFQGDGMVVVSPVANFTQ